MGQRTVKELGMDKYTLLNLKLVTNKDLLYSTWNSAQCYMWQSRREGSLEENDTYIYIYICMAESLCCPPEDIITLLIGHTPIQNKSLIKNK